MRPARRRNASSPNGGLPPVCLFGYNCAMKNALYLAAALVVASTGAAFGSQRLEPAMWADVPDVAPLRVGDTYYMVSTTMHFNPGIPVMASKDLVNWKIVSYCYQTVEDRAKDRLENGEDDYMLGTWASSIRYNEADGFFYVTSFNNKVDATYLFRTKDPTQSNWEFFRLKPKQYDESLWIEDGRFWVYATVPGRPYKVRLTEMKGDFSGFVDGGEIVLDNVTDCAGGSGLGEGSQVFKHDGMYYLVNIGWPRGRCRTVIVHRSRTMRGPWEGKVVFQHEGIAQGSFIDSPDGKWYAYMFGDRGAVGRCPYVLPVEWSDGWPVVKTEGCLHSSKDGIPGVVASDEFDSGSLGPAWQWNHNPADSLWSLSARKGWMRLSTDRTDGALETARNSLTQRCWGPACRATTKVDVSALGEGDRAGIALFQRDYAEAAVTKDGDDMFVVLRHAPGGKVREIARAKLPKDVREVHLKATGDFTRLPGADFRGNPAGSDRGRFFYSADGQTWLPLGRSVGLVYTIPHFTGYRFALFMYSTKAPGGHADFDYMRLD